MSQFLDPGLELVEGVGIENDYALEMFMSNLYEDNNKVIHVT